MKCAILTLASPISHFGTALSTFLVVPSKRHLGVDRNHQRVKFTSWRMANNRVDFSNWYHPSDFLTRPSSKVFRRHQEPPIAKIHAAISFVSLRRPKAIRFFQQIGPWLVPFHSAVLLEKAVPFVFALADPRWLILRKLHISHHPSRALICAVNKEGYLCCC